MKTVKPMRLSVVTRIVEHDRRHRLVIGVLAFFRLGEEKKELVSEMLAWPLAMAALESEGGVLDEGMAKVRGEVLVSGTCFPPNPPQAVSFVRVKLDRVDKRLAVLGDRQWKHGVPTEPVPFESMPLDWTRAFGGEGFEENPAGRGVAPVATGATTVHPLPNVEHPNRLVRAPSDRPEPAGLGGLPITLPQRKRKFGTYDAGWLEREAFGFAKDMDPTLFNLALPDQWLEGYFRGDEPYVLENLHPTRRRIEGTLPPVAARVFVTQRVFMKARCARARFVSSTLTFADFSNADIREADFSGASVFRTRYHRVQDQGARYSKSPGSLGDDAELAEAEAFGGGR